MTETRYFCDFAWLPQGWVADVEIAVDARGDIATVDGGRRESAAPRIGRYVLPGMPNVHSHAFQYAMAGLAEVAGGSEDSFWTWREAMYRCAQGFDPPALRQVASRLYARMLEAGYTAVCEFHYLHHRPDGTPYAPSTAMAQALVDAARDTGIGMTLLPVLYQTGGFDGRPLAPRQARFGYALERFADDAEQLQALRGPQLEVGIAAHSLRAVPPEALDELLALPAARRGPVHIHIAEQEQEVAECLRLRGLPPVAWLLERCAVDARWCLVHATHAREAELTALAATGATVGVCPTTEANLGDGLFALTEWQHAGGVWGIGSDSQISVSPIEELRWLEYGQRLRQRQRNRLADERHPRVGENLWSWALRGGAQASGRRIGQLQPGYRADWLVLNDQDPLFDGAEPQEVLNKLVFASHYPMVQDVVVGGHCVVRAGRHQAVR